MNVVNIHICVHRLRNVLICLAHTNATVCPAIKSYRIQKDAWTLTNAHQELICVNTRVQTQAEAIHVVVTQTIIFPAVTRVKSLNSKLRYTLTVTVPAMYDSGRVYISLPQDTV